MIPVYENTADDFNLIITYDQGQFNVKVIQVSTERVKEESFIPDYEPTFGWDVVDSARAFEIAEKLCCEFENE